MRGEISKLHNCVFLKTNRFNKIRLFQVSTYGTKIQNSAFLKSLAFIKSMLEWTSCKQVGSCKQLKQRWIGSNSKWTNVELFYKLI